MTVRRVLLMVSAISVILFGCSPTSEATPLTTRDHDVATKPPQTTALPPITAINEERSQLTIDDLMEGFDFGSPIHEFALTIPANAAEPVHIFEGSLELVDETDSGTFQIISGALEPAAGHLPEFNFEFVQQGSYLIPVLRGLIITENPYWNYLIEPGRVWQEENDQGYSRASFPFGITWKGSNAIMNGTMSFLFDENEISKVWYQITQETTIGLSADFWGLLEAKYHLEPVADSDKIKAAFTQELDQRFLTKSIEALVEDYPGVDLSAFGNGITPKHMTWYGFVINGVNYLGGCQTRYGIYPYCEYMRAPSYSTAKSAFASLALMRLAKKYDPDLPNYLIMDYVTEAAGSIGDWSAVTFDHTLDMATGNFKTAARMVDEEQWDTDPFWSEEYFAGKIAAAFNWPHSAEPGTTWVYRTSDTFIVTRALQNYLQTQQGKDADIFEFVVDEVYRPLNMGPGFFSTVRTKDDNWQGQPYGGYGLWWVPDDLAKVSTFLNFDHGTIAGEQILHLDLLNDALQRDPDDRGVIRDGNGRYNNAFWADEFSLEGCQFWVSHMYGYSGIVVSLMPNGTAYYYASDGQEFTSTASIQESNKIISMCEESAYVLPTELPALTMDQSTVSVPQGSAPTIDGTISPGEWKDATSEIFADGSELLLLKNDGYLFLGIRADTTDMIVGNIFFNQGEEVKILHSSAALGTAIYQKEADIWQQIKPFEWCCRGTSNNSSDQAARETFFQQEGWLSINSKVGTLNELEYQIEISDEPIRLAANFLRATSNPQNEKTPWPADLTDDVIKPTPGGLPAQSNFAPATWAKLEFQESN